METKFWIISGVLLVVIFIFCYYNYKRDQRKEREQIARLSARNQALLIEKNNEK